MTLDGVACFMGLDKSPKRSVKTANTVFGIIEYLLETGGADVSEIAESQEMAKSTVHSHLATLSDLEYVVKDDKTYRLSLKFLNHGVRVRDDHSLTRVAPPIIEQLSADTGEVSWIIVEEHGKAVYLLKESGENAVKTRGYVGKRSTMHDIAAGKAILTYLPDEKVADIIETYGLPQRSENTITDEDELYRELETVRERGYAVNKGETTKKVWAMASPIIQQDTVCGAVGIAGPKHRMSGERFTDSMPAKVLEAADTIELELEYQ
jgi:DNA-binding IclR family transcriptional regulator